MFLTKSPKLKATTTGIYTPWFFNALKMMIMANDTIIQVKKVTPEYTFQTCPNCFGYGAKGNPPKRVTCPSCLGKGILQIPIKEEVQK